MVFLLHHQTGSHAQFKNIKGERITVPIHAGKDLNKKTLKGIIDDLDISAEEFIKMLKLRQFLLLNRINNDTISMYG